MKTIITIIILFFTTISFGQETINTTQSFESALLPYVEKILKGLEKGVEYASEEIPIVLEQYILYEAFIAWLIILFCILSLIPIRILIKKACKFDPDWETPAMLFSYVALLIPIVLFCTHIGTAIKTTFFPKLFLVDKFIQLI